MIQPAFSFKAPNEILFGEGVVEQISAKLKAHGLKRVLIVTDPTLVKLGVSQELENNLRNAGFEIAVYANIASEPTIVHVDEGLSLGQELGMQGILAIGGGSPMDAAKAISIMATNEGEIADYKGINRVKNPKLPLFCVSTTAGTGSEVTPFTIISDSKTNVKMLIASPHLIPTIAFVDPVLTISTPKKVTASTGIDALTHAIEAYISIKANPISDMLALSAISRIFTYLPAAWCDGRNLVARTHMMLGQLEAGLSFSNSSVALVHGMSRPLGAHFNISHGLSNAILLSKVMAFTLPGAIDRYKLIAKAMGFTVDNIDRITAAETAVEAIDKLCRYLEIPGLQKAGVDNQELKKKVSKMALDALDSGSPSNNPRLATAEEIVELYYAVY